MINTAVVGVGYLGQFHAEKFSKSKTSKLVAVVDVDAERGRKVAKKTKTRNITDYVELPKLGVQCASVVTPTSTHFEIASFLLQNGIDVLLEKPMASNVEEAKQLIETAAQHGRILQVGHLERFNPAFRALQSVLTKPWFFEVRRITPYSGRGTDVDVVLDLMIHDIDIVAHLVKSPLEKVEAVGIPVLSSSVDIANARLTFQNGAVANVTASRAAFTAERTIRIFQPNVYISVDFGKKTMKIYTKREGTQSRPEVAVTHHSIEERDALEQEINAFLDCVGTRRAPEVSGVDGLRAMELAKRIQDAFAASLARLHDEGSELFVVNR